MLLGYFFEELQLVLHRCDYQVVLSLFVVLRLLFGSVPGPLRGLGSLMSLLIVVLDLADLLSFAHLAAFVVSRGDHRFPAYEIFAPDHGEFEVVSFIHLCIFGSFADGGSGESFFVPRLRRGWENKEM